MNWRFTLIVFLVFAALAVFAYTQRSAPPQQVGEGAPTVTPVAILDLDEGDVQEVGVETEDGSDGLNRVAGGWQVDGEDTNDQVDGLVGRLAALNVLRELPADRDPNDYGFATPSMTVTLRMASGDEHVLHVGDDTPVDYNVYVRKAGDTRIVIVSRGDIQSLRDWIDTPPLAPTPTPEEPPTSEFDEAGEAVDEGTGEEPNAEAGADSDGDDVADEASDGDAEDDETNAEDADDPGTGSGSDDDDGGTSDEASGGEGADEGGSGTDG